MEEAIEAATRYKHDVALALIGIDGLHDINDEFGPGVGDEVIQSVSRAIRKGLRRSDLCGRYGGDEFLVLFWQTDYGVAGELTERLRSEIHDLAIGELEPGRVTVSVGVATYREMGVRASVRHLLSAASRALRKAKHGGRDRVVMSSAEDVAVAVHASMGPSRRRLADDAFNC